MADMTRVGMRVRGAEVVTVPIDDTLTIEGQAAGAKAVGDALAQKADKSELQAAIQVNGQPADAQGLILIDGRHIPVSNEDAETLAEAVTDLKGQTAENIPMSSDSGAKTIAEVVNANAEAIENMEEMTGATMPIESGSQTTVKAAIEARVKTVNQKAPDPDGNVDLSVVPLAENLQSDKMQSVDGTFIIRTTGGSSSVSDGKAYPQHIMGTSERTGYVAEVLNMTVIPIERTEPDEPITATIDRDVFVAYVDESGTINLYYTTEWSEDPELYGVTVEGTPVAGDQIQIVYVKENRGTILVSNPGRLVGTGWNLFNFNAGYARVVRYSDEYGYKIGGAFTSIEYSETPEGDRVSILPGQNGLFQVPGDGYVFVNGGNATNTYILATWSDWTDGPATGYWEAYKESGIDLSAVMGTYFPYGMLSVENIHDEIDLSAKRTISRVERMAYTAENLAAAVTSGRDFTYDTNYIYIERAENVISAITIDTVYNVSEHGLEWFTGTTMPLITEILYGKNLRDKLERDVLTISPQTLAEEEKAQVRQNIGVMDPPTNGNGTLGQLLKTNGDGTTEWTIQGTPTDAQVGTAVSAWLEAHPEATTTVEDGAISRQKLNDDLKAKTDAVPDLKNAVDETTEALVFDSFSITWYQGSIGSNGKNNSTTKAVRTDTISFEKEMAVRFDPKDYLFYAVEYSGKTVATFVRIMTAVYTSGVYCFKPVTGYYYRFVVKKTDGTDLAPTEPTLANIELGGIKSQKDFQNIKETTEIPANSDLNDYIIPGRYHSVNASITETLDHCPVTTTGFDLIVTKTSGHNNPGDVYVRQIIMLNAHDNGDYIFTRYIGQSYPDWERVAISSDVLALVASDFDAQVDYVVGNYTIYESKYYRFKADHTAGAWDSSHVDLVTIGNEIEKRLDIDRTIAIPANSDLNDYTTPGRYHSVNTLITKTLANCPVSTTGFDLIVTKTSGHNNAGDIYVRQFLILNSPNNYLYFRYIATSYGEWQKIAVVDDWTHTIYLSDDNALPSRITAEAKKTIKVCTFNVAHYRHTNKDFLSEKPENLMCIRRFLMNKKIDIMFTQEHSEYIDESETKSAFDWLYKEFFNSDPVNTGTYAGYENKKIFTKLPISTNGTVEYVECYAHPEIADTYARAYFVWTLQELSGIGYVLLIDVHNFASAQANSANTWTPFESRKKYLDDLTAFMQTKTYDYCIIAGDFNSGNDEGLDASGKKVPLETNGDFEAILDFCSDNNMRPCNGGTLGWIKTSTELAYDNILVSNNIRIESIEADNEERIELYSDHAPIVATLSFT